MLTSVFWTNKFLWFACKHFSSNNYFYYFNRIYDYFLTIFTFRLDYIIIFITVLLLNFNIILFSFIHKINYWFNIDATSLINYSIKFLKYIMIHIIWCSYIRIKLYYFKFFFAIDCKANLI